MQKVLKSFILLTLSDDPMMKMISPDSGVVAAL